ncbi:Mrp family chromosome partitioning ATPase [Bradyrhizobium sp. S3.9.2]|uniref:tyrosine-protein kinase family protein n=1 Tax=Bradyrhizobium sp. S3.9.2 TaxID=3156432 RepID=UPI003391BAC6
MASSPGRIITFYSYKGGTGRTTTVSNIAWILASNGRRVLLIDWDLEAPGLHHQLRPFLDDPELTQTSGLVEFLSDAAERSGATGIRPLETYAVRLNWTFSGKGAIALIPAGRQDEAYAQRVNSVNLRGFYREPRGVKVLGAASEALRAQYDYVLIDSPAGRSDSMDAYTVRLPDVLVFLFTLNKPSIDDAEAATRRILRTAERIGRQATELRGRDELRIFPVPTLIENREADKLAAAMSYARQVFAPFLLHVQSSRKAVEPAQQAPYWRDVETPYVSYYAFEQVPAAFAEEPGSRQGVLASYERITYWITDRTVASLHPFSEERRKWVIEAYALKRNAAEMPLPQREEQSPRWIDLMRRGWKYATVALALVIAVTAWRMVRDSQPPSAQVGTAASQVYRMADNLRDVADGLRKAEAAAPNYDDWDDSAKAELAKFTKALERLAAAQRQLNDAQRQLNDVRAALQNPAKEEWPQKQAPPAHQRQ